MYVQRMYRCRQFEHMHQMYLIHMPVSVNLLVSGTADLRTYVPDYMHLLT